MSCATAARRGVAGQINKLHPEDQAVHDWYRFVLSFPPHLVRDYLRRFGVGTGECVLDPFCGTGTTLVESKKLGIPSIGIEANAMACFASRVKVDWRPDPDGLMDHAHQVAEAAALTLEADGVEDIPILAGDAGHPLALRRLPPDSEKLLLTDSISPLPLHKALALRDAIRQHSDDRYRDHGLLAFAKALTTAIGNLHFGPEVGVGKPKPDAAVVSPWLAQARAMADALRDVQDRAEVYSVVHQADAREVVRLLDPQSIHAVITSPPYPNEKDYTRTTRLESVLLGFIRNRAELQALKRGLLRSNTRNVYKGDDDDRWVAGHTGIQQLADAIEARRIELGKTSGFERLYATVTRLYFGGMARHLADLRPALRPGAHLAYVVGDQASYLRIMIRTGQLLAEIAQSLGYELLGIELFRTRLATATREQMREEVVILRWPGSASGRSQSAPHSRGAVHQGNSNE